MHRHKPPVMAQVQTYSGCWLYAALTTAVMSSAELLSVSLYLAPCYGTTCHTQIHKSVSTILNQKDKEKRGNIQTF